jgi:50S ribosomal subunit-associated GTPase HflX
MFATLDPTSRRLRLPREQEVIINDTVGFIRDLPPDLIAAFRATLEEIDQSDLLVHLVDASNPRWQQQLESVENILGELGHTQIPRVVAFNKADLLTPDDVESLLRQACLAGARECVALSAIDPKSVRPLLERAGEIIARNLTEGADDETRSEAAGAEEASAEGETDVTRSASAEGEAHAQDGEAGAEDGEANAEDAGPEELQAAAQSRK